MRRSRSLREYRSKHLRQRKVCTLAEQRKRAQDKLVSRKKKVIIKGNPTETPSQDKPLSQDKSLAEIKKLHKSSMHKARSRADAKQPVSRDWSKIPSSKPLSLMFSDYDNFVPQKVINVCHVIESLGLGGAQTMMAELVGGLDKYYGENTKNVIVALSPRKQSPPKKLFSSYGVKPVWVVNNEFNSFLKKSNIDIVLHHRIAVSRCLKKYLPSNVKYILINHTWNSLNKMKDFMDCDAYVSVCSFLDHKTYWDSHIHPSRRLTFLNGIENDYIQDIKPEAIAGDYKTGRCHRMVSAKFRADSLHWMNRKIVSAIPGYHHHLIGTHNEAQALSRKYSSWLTYYNTISDRNKKMGIIKQLDTYFYETFGDEGASIAVLEALASGVPVLAKNLGGTQELIIDGVNGFICNDRTLYEIRMKQLAAGVFPDIRKTTLEDFESRLHVKHVACKYVQLFEGVIDG